MKAARNPTPRWAWPGFSGLQRLALPGWLNARWPALLAVLFSLGAFWGAYRAALDAFEAIPHLEDELAYVWQANVIANGDLFIPSPEHSNHFMVPFVVDYQGQRFGKYPLGWPVVLGVGVFFGLRTLVNPLLAALAVWFSYRLGQKLLGNVVGVLMAFLTATSPFVILNSGSLLSHPLGLLLALAFVLFWLDAFPGDSRPGTLPARLHWLPPVAAGLTLGLLALTRPFTAVMLALPFGVEGLQKLFLGSWPERRRILVLGIAAGSVALLHFLWQAAATGDPFLNPYELWWHYDKIGFGEGYGVTQTGHSLRKAWINTRFSLQVGLSDLFGWPRLSWIFLPFGVWAIRKSASAALASIPFFSLALGYLAYWIGAWLFGPRYWYEGLFSLTLLTAAGVAWLAGWPLGWNAAPSVQQPPRKKWRPLAVFALFAILAAGNLWLYLPTRVASMHNLYNIRAERMEPFLAAANQDKTPAVVIVNAKHWTDYGTLLELQDPYLTTPWVFSYGGSAQTQLDLPRLFPGRNYYIYYPQTNRLRQIEP